MSADADLNQPDVIMRLSGQGGAELLHGQTTANFKQLVSGEHRYAAFCNPKGRVLADVRAVMISDKLILLRGRLPVMQQLAEHLKPFLMFARAQLAQTDWQIVACESTETAQLATIEYAQDKLTSVLLPASDGYQEHWAAPQVALEEPGATELAWQELSAARARVETQTIGQYLPQDLNFDLNETVSFTKGCYTGQEIVARLHYRGTPKRRLHHALSTVPAAPGEILVNNSNQSVGSVVNQLSQDEITHLLIELVPEAARGPVALRGSGATVTSLVRCHEEQDQFTGSR
jgi:folate-binding protein YgfZ